MIHKIKQIKKLKTLLYRGLKKGVLSCYKWIGSLLKNEIDNIKYRLSYCILAKVGVSHLKIVILLSVLI